MSFRTNGFVYATLSLNRLPRGQVENAGPGSRGTGTGVWKTRGLVENTWSGGKHGVSVENTGFGGKHVVWWKTRGLSGRGLSAKHGGTISPNNEVEILLFQIATKNNRRETRFLVIKAN